MKSGNNERIKIKQKKHTIEKNKRAMRIQSMHSQKNVVKKIIL